MKIALEIFKFIIHRLSKLTLILSPFIPFEVQMGDIASLIVSSLNSLLAAVGFYKPIHHTVQYIFTESKLSFVMLDVKVINFSTES